MYEKHSPNSWFPGLLLPCALVIYGLVCLVRQSASIPAGLGLFSLVTVYGELATAIGAACLGLGIFLHCAFWTPTSVTWRLYRLGTLIGLVVFLSSFIYFIVKYAFS